MDLNLQILSLINREELALVEADLEVEAKVTVGIAITEVARTETIEEVRDIMISEIIEIETVRNRTRGSILLINKIRDNVQKTKKDMAKMTISQAIECLANEKNKSTVLHHQLLRCLLAAWITNCLRMTLESTLKQTLELLKQPKL